MNAPGKGILKTVSILFIIFGAIVTLISLLGVLGSALLGSGLLLVATILMLVYGVLELVLGIVGVKKSGDPTKGGFFIVTGIVLCALSLASLIMSIASSDFNVTSGIGFVLPILYIVGGNMNKKAAAAPMAPPAPPTYSA